MTAITVLREEESYRLIRDDRDRYAVVEARNGHVYALNGNGDRAEAADSSEGMSRVVDSVGGWRDEAAAEQRFRSMVGNERRYSETIW